MSTYKILQPRVSIVDRELAETGEHTPNMQAYRSATIMGDVSEALKLKLYYHTADIDAVNLDEVYEIGNIRVDRVHIKNFTTFSSVSVGDIIIDEEDKVFAVAIIGFDDLGITATSLKELMIINKLST